MAYCVVMPAAGTGQRMGSDTPKQYLPLLHKTVIEWSLLPFIEDARCEAIAVSVAADDQRRAAIALLQHPKVRVCAGGADRASSVSAGLCALAESAAQDSWVLVHDAARPCLDSSDLNRLLALRDEKDSVGGLLAMPLADTLKQADGHRQVSATLPRAGLWRAQTPQMFRLGVLRRALEQALAKDIDVTDEASAIEALGLKPMLVAGRSDNLKITFAEDLLLAEYILSARQRGAA